MCVCVRACMRASIILQYLDIFTRLEVEHVMLKYKVTYVRAYVCSYVCICVCLRVHLRRMCANVYVEYMLNQRLHTIMSLLNKS